MTRALQAANILVVDDAPENLRLLCAILGESGYEVRPVTNGRQALQAAELHPPDLVLLDITMPEMDGYEVCGALKRNARLKDIPVIFLTALSEIADKLRAFEVGGVDYVTKPFQLEEVRARVETHLALRRANVDLSESYARLQALERLRDDLVHMVVHDMRSPLSVLLGHLDLLQDEQGLSPDGKEDLRAAVQGARALSRMTNDLLDVSRLESGAVPLQVATHELAQLAHDAGAALQNLERGRAIAVEATAPVSASCDARLIARVLENLIGNAIKHTPAESDVTISVTSSNGRAKVTVSDRGPGVPVEARQRIFEKFGTVGGAGSSRYHSAGLGLAFCKLAVEAHGGTIGVEPREPHGSQFWFELPAITPPR
jgi:two-component system sensor histidine kinase/response regulator